MSFKNSGFIKNLSYTFIANIISLVISTFVILVVPQKSGVTEYGYFQLYLFYTSYVGFFHFGWFDGLYLREGGKHYTELNKKNLRLQFLITILIELVVAMFIIALIPLLIKDNSKRDILNFTVIATLLLLPRTMLWLLLQAIGEITDYAKFVIIEKIVYITVILFVIYTGHTSYKYLILADLLSKAVSFIYTCLKYTDIIVGKLCSFTEGLWEIRKNIEVGSKLMFANIASLLIIGVARFSIEAYWGIEAFSKISLTISICNLLLVFINAIGLVLFPMLKRMPDQYLHSTYSSINIFLSALLLPTLIAYFPLKTLLINWLPQYIDSIFYMSILFPICIFESKVALLFTTFLKIKRCEKNIMVINLSTVLLSLLLAIINVYVIKSLIFGVFSIIFVLWFRYILNYHVVACLLKTTCLKEIVTDTSFCVLFIALTHFLPNTIIGALLYFIILIIYYFTNRSAINASLKTILNMTLS